MSDKIIDLREGRKIERKWFDIKRSISLSVGEKRKRSKLIKILNKAALSVAAAAIIVFGLRLIFKERAKTIGFYDFIPSEAVSFNSIRIDFDNKEKVIGGVLDGLGVFDEEFEKISGELAIEIEKVLGNSTVNVENEIIPYLGENMGLAAIKTADNNDFILFVELKGSLKDLSYTKGKVEKEIEKLYNLEYITHKGVSIASISNFNSDIGFSWVGGHYAFIDQYFVFSDSLDRLKSAIEKRE